MTAGATTVCDKKCENHSTQMLLTTQHAERITNLEGMVIENSNDNNNIEGRVNAFIYMIGIAFFLMVSLSYFGFNKINSYKEIDTTQAKEYNKVLSELTAEVRISSERAMDVKNSQNSLLTKVNDIHVGQELIKEEITSIKKNYSGSFYGLEGE